MKIALIGATGTIGRRIAAEALQRGHEVTAIVRDPARLDYAHEKLRAVPGDVADAASVSAAVSGQDAVISAIGPSHEAPGQLVELTRSLLEGVQQGGVRRLLAVGGAGSLEVAPGVQLVDTPAFPEAWRGVANAHRDALALFQTVELDWTNVSPAALIEPGERTGRYRTGKDQLLVDAEGNSRISAEDYAVALLDELERPAHIGERITVAY